MQPSPAATLAARMTRLARPPQLPARPTEGTPMSPQAMPQQLTPVMAPPRPSYGGMVGGQPAMPFHPHAINSVLQQLTQRTRNPQPTNLAGLYQRFLMNQGIQA